MQQLINCPHTWLCKQMGLPTRTTQAMQEGREAHRRLQEHCSGVKIEPLFKNLPTFSQVETMDRDPNMEVKFKINDKYSFHGFVDGRSPERGDFLEAKFGKVWSPGDFARLIQWKLYSIPLLDYNKVWMVNAPRNPAEWNELTIRVYNQDIKPAHAQQAWKFISQAIEIIENIKNQELYTQYPSRWCNYIDCPFCGKASSDEIN